MSRIFADKSQMKTTYLKWQMRSVLIIAFVIKVNPLIGQRVELFTGVNRNRFYDKDPIVVSSYTPGLGFCIGMGIDSIKIGKLKTRLTLQFDSYQGSVKVDREDINSGQSINAQIGKSVLGFCFFPLNIRIKKIDFNLGVETSILTSESRSGMMSGYDPFKPTYPNLLQDKRDRFSSRIHGGFKVRMAYDIYLSNLIAISPEYLFYLGLTSEFNQFPLMTKSMRQYACIGISMKIRQQKTWKYLRLMKNHR